MALNARPFWKILMITAEHDAYVTLNCDECFLILEFLAEEAIHGMEERRLVQAGVQPWLDKWNLIPGDPWQPALERALDDLNTEREVRL